VQNLRA